MIWGAAPDGVAISPERSLAPAKVTTGETSYYYIDRYIRSPMPADSFVRAYVNETNVLRRYIPLRIRYYGGAAAIFVVLTLAMLYALRRFRHSIRTMEESVAKIGTSQFLDQKMDETGHYLEISALIQAHNRMLDRMQDIFEQQEQFSSASFAVNFDGDAVMGDTTNAKFVKLEGSQITVDSSAPTGETAIIGAANANGTYRTMTFVNGGDGTYTVTYNTANTISLYDSVFNPFC